MKNYVSPLAEIKKFEVNDNTMISVSDTFVPDPEGFEGGGLH